MRGIGLGLLASLCVWIGPAAAVDLADSQPPTGAAATARPMVALARIVSSIPQGYNWVTLQTRFFPVCEPRSDGSRGLPWTGRTGDVDDSPYVKTVVDALDAAGFASADDPDNLFQKERGASDLAIAANVKDIRATLCARRERLADAPTGAVKLDPKQGMFLDIERATGSASLIVDWQLYSRSRDRVLYKTQITSSFEIKDRAPGNYEKLVQAVMDENIKAFIASTEFKTAVLSAADARSLPPQARAKLLLVGAPASNGVKISDAIGSVVLIQSNGGHGSGFLVSSDGYVMTARHVVGEDKFVKIRWSDGLEGLGEIVRTDKPRDVALIKADPRGRLPLGLRRTPAQPGDTVFAIGAPIDPKLQNTVTRGVVSANNRIIDGFSFIQSDVTVDPGNSGGPLLDEQGQVLGFTDLGMRTADAPTGLNFFVPIDDALRFLSAEPQ